MDQLIRNLRSIYSEKLHYSEISARRHIRAAQHLVYWAQQQHVALAKIDDALVVRFRRHLRQCRCRPYGSSHPGSLVKGAHLFLGHLESINVIPTRVKINQKPETPGLLYSFRQWMRSNRDIGEATLYNYSLAVGDLLQTLGENPSHFDVQRIRQFFIDRTLRCGKAKVQNMVTALRAFIRYLINLGLCPVGLDAAIPTPAHWHLSRGIRDVVSE